MDAEIDKQAMKAASKEQPAWKTVVAVLLIIVVIVVVALVIGPAVIGAVGAAAGALGAGAATAGFVGAVVGGAIVGAATSATIQVLNNWRTGERLSAGVGRAAIMGAIGGALGGGAGFLIGKAVTSQVLQFAANIAADAVLELGTQLVTGEFSLAAFGMAVLMSVVTGGFGEIRGVKGIQARMQYRGAHVVPGAGARAYAARIRPAAAEAAPGRAPGEPSPEPPKVSDAPEAGAPRLEEGTAASVSERPPGEGAAARPEPAGPSRLEADPDVPARERSDAELRDGAIVTKVGADDHVIVARKVGEDIELWICSAACGPIKAKIDDMMARLPPSHDLRNQLADLKTQVETAEGRMARGEASKDVMAVAADIAARFNQLGKSDPVLGSAVDDPSALGGRTAARPTTAEPPPRPGGTMGQLDVKVTSHERIRAADHEKLQLDPDADVLYVLRDVETGAVLKVGKTTGGSTVDRFATYERAGRRLGRDLQIEVATIATPRGRTPQEFESALRAQLEGEGQIMPWDNSGNRLSREGQGTPYAPLGGSPGNDPVTGKPIPGMRDEYMWDASGNLVRRDGRPIPAFVRKNAAPTREEVTVLLTDHGGDVEAIAAATGRSPRSVYRWLTDYGIRMSDFR
jgi:hypothetical protein